MKYCISSALKQNLAFYTIRFFSFSILIVLFIILGYIAREGFSVISWNFITKMPENEMTGGGIMPAIVGTFWLIVGSSMVSIPVGISTAVYLNEYAGSGRTVGIIRMGVNNLAGVPSVVFGLFGLSFFVVLMDFGTSIIAGSFTIGILNLPVIIRSTEEALSVVPETYREASLSLGATRWQTISRIILPGALPGILTGIMLSLARAAGETAPVMFTAAVFYTPDLPASVFDQVMSLPYHIYIMATAGTHVNETRPVQYGTAFVLIIFVFLFNSSGVYLRYRFRKKNRL